MTGSGRALLRRVVREHRRILVPLGIALLVNIVAYAFIVNPLAQRVANIAERDLAAERELAGARKEHADALGTVTGKDRAAQELMRFYMDVLPHDFQSARDLTHTRIPQLAKQLNIAYDSAIVTPPARRPDSTLVRYSTKVQLAGRYKDIRTFIHQLETSPEFVVIDNISLSEEDDENGLLELALQLSTYYKAVE